MADSRQHPVRGRRCRAVTACACLALAVSAGGCASHRAPRPAGPATRESLADAIARVRAVSAAAKARPAGSVALTIELSEPGLAAALGALALAPTAEGHWLVAIEYRRLGILDAAYAQYAAAVRLDPGNAAAHDGLARIWRDWGVPHLGLADAYRAVKLAPTSPTAANTLGTLLDATGRRDLARRWYERAVRLDPRASYALGNLCYAELRMRDHQAVTTCRRALGAAPGSTIAHNNLALAYAVAGESGKARQQFEAGGGDNAAHYNMGIVHLAQREYRKAAAEFGTALLADPRSLAAAERARQARTAAIAEEEGNGRR